MTAEQLLAFVNDEVNTVDICGVTVTDTRQPMDLPPLSHPTRRQALPREYHLARFDFKKSVIFRRLLQLKRALTPPPLGG